MPPVCIDDPVYGETCFTEPLIADIYASEAVQRLAHIYQGGITAFIKPERRTTRLDHSLGVAALLRRMGASTEEQAAGLVHDVAHTAFSHVVDFVFPNQDHDYHETHRTSMISRTDLPDVLARHGIDWRWLTDADNFPLLERPLPDLCADRLDYFLRDGVVDFHEFSAAEAQAFITHLRVYQNQIVVDNIDTARWLGGHFIALDDACWCSVQEVGWYAVMGQALQVALAKGIITEADFAGVDVDVLARLRSADDPEVNRWLSYLRPDVDFARNPDAFDLWALPKVRAVDPPVLMDGQILPLSQLDPAFAERRDAYIAGKQGRWALQIVENDRHAGVS